MNPPNRKYTCPHFAFPHKQDDIYRKERIQKSSYIPAIGPDIHLYVDPNTD